MEVLTYAEIVSTFGAAGAVIIIVKMMLDKGGEAARGISKSIDGTRDEIQQVNQTVRATHELTKDLVQLHKDKQ